MTEADSEKKQKTKDRKNPLKRLAWITVYLAVFLFVVFTVLANLGGSGDVFRESLEQYLGDVTPYSAKISRLNSLYFFPEIVIDVEGVELSSRQTGEPVIFVGRARMATGFFDVMFKRQRYRVLELERLQAQTGSILNKPLIFDRIGFQDEKENETFLAATGNVDGKAFEIKIGFEAKGDEKRRSYAPAEDMEIRAALENATFSGLLKDDPQGDLKLENVILRYNAQDAVIGDFNLERLGIGRFSLKGRAEILPHKTVLNPDMEFQLGVLPAEIRGNVNASPFNIADFTPGTPLAQVADLWGETFGPLKASVDLGLVLENFTSGGVDWGTVQTRLALEKGDLKIGPLGGKIMDGELSGVVFLKTAAQPMTLDAQVDVRNLDYALLQKQFDEKAKIEGRADLWIDLNGAGENMQVLADTLAGKVVVVSGKGRIGLDSLSLWAEGLPGILMQDMPPDMMLDLTCAIADLDINGGMARSSAIFADTAQVRIQAAGQYDFGQDLLEMTVYSRSGAGQPSTAHMQGPLSDLKVSAGRFGASGSLEQGAASPDFKPLSLSGKRLKADHPCRAFVIETEVLDAPATGETR